VPPASLRVGPSNDHELLAIEALQLDPDPAVARCVWSVGSLGDDAFQTQLAGVLTETRAVTSHILIVPQPLKLLQNVEATRRVGPALASMLVGLI
jgi:hypothetical protein